MTLDLVGRVVDEYMTGGFTPTMFISLDTTMEQWCQQIEDAYAGVLTGLEEEEDADAGSQMKALNRSLCWVESCI